MSHKKILSINSISKTFGSIFANDKIDLELFEGEILALLGENGAGKTTLMNMLFGHYMPDDGSIDIMAEDGDLVPLSLGNPQIALGAGIGMVHQHFTLANNLTVYDNIVLGSEPLFAIKRDRSRATKKINEIIEKSGLNADLNNIVSNLSVGERQRVEILKALYRDAKILVLDEPTAVLTPQEADSLFSNIKTMTKSGLSVIFISHKLREVLDFSDRIAVLRAGKKVGEMNTRSADEKKIALMMVGGETNVTVRSTFNPGVEIISLENISAKGHSARDSLENISLSVRRNEIVGVAGVSGNGQVCLANIVAGIQQPDSGEIIVNQNRVNRLSPSKMIETGIGRIPEDRHQDGIVGAMSVAENMVIERLSDKNIQSNGFLKSNAIISNAKTLSATYDVRGPGINAKAQLLSGGNIQKLILARVFDKNPEILLVNQPTRGLDMGAAAEVRRRLLEARAGGAGILLISEDLDEILALADTVLVMSNGALIQAQSRNRQEIGLAMAGGEN
jgi:simple sugar transport system ATP-binding protein